MGAAACNSWVSSVRTSHTGTRPPAQTKRDVPDYTPSHRGRGKLDDGHPIAVLWQQEKMALQIELRTTNIV